MKADMDMMFKHDTTRIGPLIAGAVVSLLGLIVIGAVTGVLPGVLSQKPGDAAAAQSFVFNPSPAGGCAICGTVESIRSLEVRGDATEPVVVRERQPGKNEDNAVMTILGPGGGTSAGNEMEMNAAKRQVFRVTVRMDDGSFRTVSISNPPGFTIGDKVRVVQGRLVRA
jgi:outer membrane lipoprotein SlyB